MKKKKILNKNKLFFNAITFWLFFIQITLFAQSNVKKSQIKTETKTSILNQLIVVWKSKAYEDKLKAEQWAISKGYPISGHYDGGSFELMSLDEVTGMPSYNGTDNYYSVEIFSNKKQEKEMFIMLFNVNILRFGIYMFKMKANEAELETK